MLLPASFKQMLWRRLAARLGLRYRFPEGGELVIESFSDWCTCGDLFMRGEYDPAILAALARAQSGQCFRFVDLGANVGYFTQRVLLLGRRSGRPAGAFRGLLVDATPPLRAELHRRLASWQAPGLELDIRTAAVGPLTGSVRIADTRAHSRNHIQERAGGAGWDVPCLDLREPAPGFEAIDLLKVDIEGAEALLLANAPALFQRAAVVAIECHPPLAPADRVRAHLTSWGFHDNGTLRDDPEGTTLWFTRA